MLASFDGCDRDHFGRGYCSAHYTQYAKGRPLTPIRVRTPTPEHCTVPGCLEPHKALGLCRWHYDRRARCHDVTILRDDAAAAARQRKASERKPRPGKTPTPRPVSTLPAGWDKVTPPKVHTRTRTSTRGDALGPLVPLSLETVGAALAVLDRHDALDLVDALGLREMAEHARGLKAAS